MESQEMSLAKLEKLIKPDQVAMLDSSYVLAGVLPWERAISLVVSDEAAILIERSNGDLIRSQKLTLRKPVVIALNKYVGAASLQKTFQEGDTVSKAVVLTRDDHTCWICGGHGTTVDHLLPKSRGGKSTYGNLATACRKCNELKRDLTPKEIGREWPHIPRTIVSKRRIAIQEAIYEVLGAIA